MHCQEKRHFQHIVFRFGYYMVLLQLNITTKYDPKHIL